MEEPTAPTQKQIVLTYIDNGGNDLDIRLDSEGFEGNVEMVTVYLHKTIQAILNSSETSPE